MGIQESRFENFGARQVTPGRLAGDHGEHPGTGSSSKSQTQAKICGASIVIIDDYKPLNTASSGEVRSARILSGQSSSSSLRNAVSGVAAEATSSVAARRRVQMGSHREWQGAAVARLSETTPPPVAATSAKADSVSIRTLKERGIEHKTQGKAKKVYADKTHVYLVPNAPVGSRAHKSKLEEMQKEKGTADDIRHKLSQHREFKEVGRYIATDLEVLHGDERIDSLYTLKAKKADSDLEEAIRSPLSVHERCDLSKQILGALAGLQAIGYVHGDLKLDNFLFYKEENRVELSDFGKTQTIDHDEVKMHFGNPRYAAPEGVLSKKAEVYSAALVIVRVMEEALLSTPASMERNDGTESGYDTESYGSDSENTFSTDSGVSSARSSADMSTEIFDREAGSVSSEEEPPQRIYASSPKPRMSAEFDLSDTGSTSSYRSDSLESRPRSMILEGDANLDQKYSPDAKRRGIEKFLILNRATPQRESNVATQNALMRTQMAFKFLIHSQGKRPESADIGSTETTRYINALFEELNPSQNPSLEQLKQLLISMADGNPEARPSMEEAYRRMQSIAL